MSLNWIRCTDHIMELVDPFKSRIFGFVKTANIGIILKHAKLGPNYKILIFCSLCSRTYLQEAANWPFEVLQVAKTSRHSTY